MNQVNSQGQTGTVVSWSAGSPALGAWCKIEATRGQDRFQGGQEVSQTFYTLTLWWTPIFQSGMHAMFYPNGAGAGIEMVITSTENVLQMSHILQLFCVAIGKQALYG